MILQDEQGKKWNFQPTGEDTQNKNNMMGFLSPAKEKTRVEGSIIYNNFKNKIGYAETCYPEYLQNISNETLIKTIVQCWFPECTYVYRTASDNIVFYDENENPIGKLESYIGEIPVKSMVRIKRI